MKKLFLVMPLAAMLLSACSSTPTKDQSDTAKLGRVFLDSSTHEDSLPKWAKGKVAWEDNGKVIFHATHTILGSQSVDGCYDLAKLDSSESLLGEISNDIKGRIDNSSTSINEDAETILAKSRSSEYAGQVTGLRVTENYFERYSIGGTERVNCHVLAEIRQGDYNRIKHAIVDKVIAADPRVKEAVMQNQIDFFKPQERNPSATPDPSKMAADQGKD